MSNYSSNFTCFGRGTEVRSEASGSDYCVCSRSYVSYTNCELADWDYYYPLNFFILSINFTIIIVAFIISLLEFLTDLKVNLAFRWDKPTTIIKGLVLIGVAVDLSVLIVVAIEHTNSTAYMSEFVMSILVGIEVGALSVSHNLSLIGWVTIVLQAKTLTNHHRGLKIFRISLYVILAVCVTPYLVMYILSTILTDNTTIRSYYSLPLVPILLLNFFGGLFYLSKLLAWAKSNTKGNKTMKRVVLKTSMMVLVTFTTIPQVILQVYQIAVPVYRRDPWSDYLVPEFSLFFNRTGFLFLVFFLESYLIRRGPFIAYYKAWFENYDPSKSSRKVKMSKPSRATSSTDNGESIKKPSKSSEASNTTPSHTNSSASK